MGIQIPAGAFDTSGPKFLGLNLGAAADALTAFLKGQKDLTEQDRQRNLDQMAELIKLHGPDVVNLPQFKDIYKRVFGTDYPTQQVTTPAVTERRQVGEKVMPTTRFQEAIAQGATPTELTAAGMPQTKTFPIMGEAVVTPARTEARPLPLGGASFLGQPLNTVIDEATLQQLGVPKGLWGQRTGEVLKSFPGIGQTLFSQTGRLQAQREEAKFLQNLLFGDISRLSPSQLQLSLQRYNTLVAANPDLGMTQIDPKTSRQMIHDTINYQLAQGRMGLLDAQTAKTEAETRRIYAMTPAEVSLLQERVNQIRELLPEQKALLGAKIAQINQIVKQLVDNKGMTPYQAAQLAIRQAASDRATQLGFLSAYATAVKSSRIVNPLTGQMTIDPNMDAIAQQLYSFAFSTSLGTKMYPVPSQGRAVSHQEILEQILATKQQNPGMSDLDIVRLLQAWGIPWEDFAYLLPGAKKQTTGR